MTTKTGRGRFYRITPTEDFKNRALAMKSSWMDEMRTRVYDQIEDLVPDALNHEAPGTNLSIGKLVLHLAWAEAHMMSRITGEEMPSEIADAVTSATRANIGDAAKPSPPASVLIALCEKVRNEVTIPGLKDRDNPDTVCYEDDSTPRGILDQLLWHWVYHSGQIGLIRFEWGSDYNWTFDGAMAPEPC